MSVIKAGTMNEKIARILNNKNVKITAVRELVLGVFLENRYALSLSEIENKHLPWSDRVSIFRTLKTFEQNGVIHKINDGTDAVKYALCIDECDAAIHVDLHPHFHCEKCGTTICLEKQLINLNKIPNEIVVKNYSLILNGLCANCKECN